MRVRLRGEVIRAGQVTLDVARLVADVGGGPVHLTRLEFLLLRELAEHAGHAVSKGELLATVWGYDFDPGSNVVDVCVRRLRSKLGFDLIKTVRGEGYQLVARLRRRGGCPLPRAAPAARFGWPYPPRAIDVGWMDLRPGQPRLHVHVPGLGDGPVPPHLGEPHARLRVPHLEPGTHPVGGERGAGGDRGRHRL